MAEKKHDISTIEGDLRYQEIGWKVQRIFFVLMTAFLAIGLCGGLGDSSGFLSTKQITTTAGVLEYERLMRVQKASMMKLMLAKDSDGRVELAFPTSFFTTVKLTEVIPEPAEYRLEHGQILLTFDTEGEGQIYFFVTPKDMGSYEPTFRINGELHTIPMFIYF